jgi:glutamyl-tRNA reductase
VQYMQSEIISIAEACLGGLRGRSALLIGPEKERSPYKQLLQEAGIKIVLQEKDYTSISTLLPQVQLLMNVPETGSTPPLLHAATIAEGCIGRHTPLLIFDLASSTSVEEIAGLLPAVCLYTPSDLSHVLQTAPNICSHGTIW